ncbi:hypothetical protein D9758_011857 [Tetrapyrgos nigripes]|uniref:Uncharacterized protein n=1 Tax=Tetrapyrgos nigripes TaxID=182062 RepID=A0A8H5CKI9_9AGAR|nr:hypothetical protein D9758_011857 [Tetrapyrgos nigripes]
MGRESIDEPLVPLQRPTLFLLGINPAYANHDEEFVLKLQEKRLSVSGDDFYINDAAGNPFLHCKGKFFSLRSRMEFYDLRGQLLFIVKRKLMSMHITFEGHTPDESKVLFTVKNSWRTFGSARAKITFTNIDGQETELALRGDFFDRKASVTLGDPEGPLLCRISRSFLNKRYLLTGKDTYYLTIAPGVDAAFMAAICVCLDEKENESCY